jgi:hypothetical protein
VAAGRPEPIFPVGFDEDALAEDLEQLKACQAEGRDGTKLGGCVKTYVTGAPTGARTPSAILGAGAPATRKPPIYGGFRVRLNGVEPSRPVRDTRPSNRGFGAISVPSSVLR